MGAKVYCLELILIDVTSSPKDYRHRTTLALIWSRDDVLYSPTPEFELWILYASSSLLATSFAHHVIIWSVVHKENILTSAALTLCVVLLADYLLIHSRRLVSWCVYNPFTDVSVSKVDMQDVLYVLQYNRLIFHHLYMLEKCQNVSWIHDKYSGRKTASKQALGDATWR